MELADYLTLLRKRWLSITVLTTLGLLAGIAASSVATPLYTARAELFISARGTESLSDLVQGSTFTSRVMRSYVRLAQTPHVLQPVIDELDLDTTPAALAGQVRAENPLDTVLLDLVVEDASPQRAADIANAVARSVTSAVEEIERPDGAAASHVKLTLVRAAVVPSTPSSPNTQMNVALGLLVGLALGVGLAVLRAVLDTKVRTVTDVRHLTDAPVIGVVGHESDDTAHPLTILEAPPGAPHVEAFLRLRTSLRLRRDPATNSPGRAIAVTSALPGEGKSTTATNIAVALARAGSTVALVDADLRAGTIAATLGIDAPTGLSAVLAGDAEADDVARTWGTDNLTVIPAGPAPHNPSELLDSERMRRVVHALTHRHDAVIIDTPALLPVTDGAIVAHHTRAAIVVAGAGDVDKAQLDEALAMLDSVDAQVLGVVVNRVA
ncbi:capsular exopolysaccharide family [Xylanimonas cellulosilytica DSM 15894]|uniref:Capsular exopolysaccharide family n=1 Tax=Xylanimonas cellulosilytica (strain DSM 15894 / JCM 12276 / CECT 5975 / KCTC 9989 / LMG 20990 / NBRC 107835 / XIL07) TaxID=446471 RepID=D1BYM7_XYLCX|nr:polysaccharide biosynthesis tyrosine autokinase [Xylanimonas cellulosilytica]ACZ31899.1 capsular exopolysaccharide family [Xylanimonas cellulosilytica DSM 15894]